MNWIEKNGEEALLPALGMSNHQLFFVGFAQVCMARITCVVASHLTIHTPDQPFCSGNIKHNFKLMMHVKWKFTCSLLQKLW